MRHPATFTTTFALALALALPAADAIDSRHSYVTEHEIHGFGDFDGDGLLDVIVVDRVSGNFRIGQQTGAAALDWSAAQASGVPEAEAIAVGAIFGNGREQLLVAGTFANRVHLLAPGTEPPNPIALEMDGLGPKSVAAVDIAFAGNDPARDDIVVVSGFNGGDDMQVVYDTSGGLAKVNEFAIPKPQRRGSRVHTFEANPAAYGYFELDPATGAESFFLANAQTPTIGNLDSIAALPAGSDYVHSPFHGGGNANQFVFFLRGDNTIRVSDMQPGSLLQEPVDHDLGLPVDSISLVQDSARIGIFVVFGDGRVGKIYHFDNAGTPVESQSIYASSGERINGLLGFAPDNFALLTGPRSGGVSERIHHFRHDGNAWGNLGTSDLPAVGSAVAATNIFLYEGEPLVDEEAKLVKTLQISDWSSTLMINGGNASIVAETSGTSGDGLGGARTVSLGSVPAGVDFGFANQLVDEVSLSATASVLGALPPQIGITPPPGEYDRYITPQLTSQAFDEISAHYRVGEGVWIEFEEGDAITPPQLGLDAFTVYYYAEAGGVRSPIYHADYRFSGEPGSIDSDGDGVPDFVEAGHGLDPTGGADSDEDGHSDLRELLLGSDPGNGAETRDYTDVDNGGSATFDVPPSMSADFDGDGVSDFNEWASGSNPADSSDTPAQIERLDFQGVFDLAVRPLSHDGAPGGGPVNPSWPVSNTDHTPTNLRAFNLNNQLLAQAPTDLDDRDNFAGVAAFLEDLPSDGRDLFVVVGTDPTFDTKPDGDSASGRELLGLVPVPAVNLPPVEFAIASVNPLPEGIEAAWVAAAKAHYAALDRPLVEQELTLDDSLDLLLFERIIAILISLRDPGFPVDEMSLTPFRDALPGINPGAQRLLALQKFVAAGDSGYLLKDLFAEIAGLISSDPDPRAANLRQLAGELYQISGGLGDADPAKFPNPFDTLRAFLRGDALPASYIAELTLDQADVILARDFPNLLLSRITPRPTQTFIALVTPETFDQPIPLLENVADGSQLRLFTASHDPFVFPRGIGLPVGATLSVLAFTDRATLPTDGVEVISATLTSVPEPPRTDADRNLIDDAWENFFFGADSSTSPFRDDDGDGFSNLQESLENTDPTSAASRPVGVPKLPLAPPPVDIELLPPDQVRVWVSFPERYADDIGFVLLSGNGLVIPLNELPGGIAARDGADTFGVQFTQSPGQGRAFFRFRMFLKP